MPSISSSGISSRTGENFSSSAVISSAKIT
jgi:hypothetical protein